MALRKDKQLRKQRNSLIVMGPEAQPKPPGQLIIPGTTLIGPVILVFSDIFTAF